MITMTMFQTKKIDPTTSNKEYTAEQCRWIKATEAYRKDTGRKFMTDTEFLDIAHSLGYRKLGHSS